MFLIVFGVNRKKVIPKILIVYISKRAIKFFLLFLTTLTIGSYYGTNS